MKKTLSLLLSLVMLLSIVKFLKLLKQWMRV